MGLPAASFHDGHRADGYRRHQPEQTVLYQLVEKHWPAFLERAEQHGGLPKFVVREMEEYLRCGRLEHGCLHLVCRACGHAQLVAFSCKRRGFCPSCCGRRMADMAVHLEQSVLPAVPIRHWICSLPWGLRALLGYDRKLCAEVVGAFATELSRSLKRRAKSILGLASMADAHTGAIAAVQRTDSALRLNVHAHVLALDGVYVRGAEGGPLVFHALPTPSRAEIADVARRTAERIEHILRAHGRSLDPEMQHDAPPSLVVDEPALAACYAAAARGISFGGDGGGQPTLRLVALHHESGVDCGTHRADEPVAEVRGVNVHAKQRIDGRDRRQLERLCRYITRPPVAQERLALRADGRIELTLKNIWRDGTRALVFVPNDVLTRLVAAVAPPGFHLLRYFGLLSSHAALRGEVVPTPAAAAIPARPPHAQGDQLSLLAGDDAAQGDQLSLLAGDDAERPRTRKPWAWLLKHVFQADLQTCPRCAGPMRWAEAATTPGAIARLLAKHGLAPQPPPPRSPVPPRQLALPFGL